MLNVMLCDERCNFPSGANNPKTCTNSFQNLYKFIRRFVLVMFSPTKTGKPCDKWLSHVSKICVFNETSLALCTLPHTSDQQRSVYNPRMYRQSQRMKFLEVTAKYSDKTIFQTVNNLFYHDDSIFTCYTCFTFKVIITLHSRKDFG